MIWDILDWVEIYYNELLYNWSQEKAHILQKIEEKHLIGITYKKILTR